nr:MAG TPA: hypothetical protein [Caudoviricetes sp.]
MNDIQVFDFEDNAVRVIEKDGEPWFVAADVCRVLDLSNPSKACADLDDDEAALTNSYTRSESGVEQNRQMLIVNESGLYNLIFRSRKPEAKKFRKWVTAEVLPSIRKTGMYVAPEMDCRAPDGARNDGDGFADLPDRTFQQWINLVRETRLLFGREAARRVWDQSPLPSVGTDEGIGCYDVPEFTAEDGRACLDIIVSACFDGAAVKHGSGVRPYMLRGRKYLFVAMSHPFIRRLFDGGKFSAGRHIKALLALPECVRPRAAVRVGSWQGRGVLVPYPEARAAAA